MPIFKTAIVSFATLISLFNLARTSFAQVPADVIKAIMADASADHPEDYSTQEYVLKQQTKSYLEVLALTKRLSSREGQAVIRKAAQDHPSDYSTQAYVIRGQIESLKRLTALAEVVNPPIVTYPNPADLISRLNEQGMHDELSWRKSRSEDGWISQLRFYNGEAGNKLSSSDVLKSKTLLNEVNCQLTGPDQNSVSEIRFEIEIYDSKQSVQTAANAKAAIETLIAPSMLTRYFIQGKNHESKYWSVVKSKHTNGTGYDIVATIHFPRAIQAPGIHFDGAKQAAKKYVLKHCEVTNAPDFHYEVKTVEYLNEANFIVKGFVDDPETKTRLIERHFECVVRIEDGYWKPTSIKWTKWKQLDKRPANN